MKIKLGTVDAKSNAYYYFIVIFNRVLYNTSNEVARLLNIGVEEYNERLITKVIPGRKYKIIKEDPTSCGDLNFIIEYTNSDDKQAYVEQFKNEFAKELTALILGGI